MRMIPSYRISKELRKKQRFQNKTIDEIPSHEWEGIRQRILKLQSPIPEVSIIIIAWNEERNLLCTLDSLSELKPNYSIEIIVVDNNSTDSTAEIIKESGAQYVLETTQGYAAARQAGLKVAKGKFIMSGDADTLYPPDWVNSMVDPLQEQGVVCTSGLYAFYTEGSGHPLSLRLYQIAKHISVLMKAAKRPHLVCMGGTMGFKKETSDKVGGYDLSVVRGSDGTLAWELGHHGKISIVMGRKGMVWTSMRRTMKDGNLWTAFVRRFRKDIKPFFEYFTTQKSR